MTTVFGGRQARGGAVACAGNFNEDVNRKSRPNHVPLSVFDPALFSNGVCFSPSASRLKVSPAGTAGARDGPCVYGGLLRFSREITAPLSFEAPGNGGVNQTTASPGVTEAFIERP